MKYKIKYLCYDYMNDDEPNIYTDEPAGTHIFPTFEEAFNNAKSMARVETNSLNDMAERGVSYSFKVDKKEETITVLYERKSNTIQKTKPMTIYYIIGTND